MESRAERVGRNEALFREVNERINDVAVGTDAEFFCECGEAWCTTLFTMTLAEYRSLRADPRRFAVVAGHEVPEVERVIERNERYAVVEKFPGEPTEIAVASDSRS